MERQYKQLARRVYRFFRHPRRRGGGGLRGWIAEKLFDRTLWVPRRHPFINGLATGLFFAMMPMFVPQIAISILICIWRRWNIPPAFLACWVSNVATWVPQVYWQIMIGTRVLECFVPDTGTAQARVEFSRRVREWWASDETWRMDEVRTVLDPLLLSELSVPWFLGCLITGVALAVAGLAIGHSMWGVFAHRVEVPHKVPHRPKS